MLCGKKGEGVDDATRERIDVLTQVADLEVRAREILADVMEFLHAEIQARIEITIRTRGMSPPYTIDGEEYADPRYVTVRMRTELMHIVGVTHLISQYRWYGIEHLKVALLHCNAVLTQFANKFDEWGGLTVRSAFLGKPDRAKERIEAMRTLAETTACEIAQHIAAAQHDTLDPTGADLDPDPVPEDE